MPAVLRAGLGLMLSLGAAAWGCAAPQGTPDPAGSAAAVQVYDPTGQSPAEIAWQVYPAPPPPGLHWQHTGSPAIKLDPQGRPLPGQNTGTWILVRDGYRMPMIR